VNPTFKVFLPDSAGELNPDLPIFSTNITKFYCLKDFKGTFQLKTFKASIEKVAVKLYIGDMAR